MKQGIANGTNTTSVANNHHLRECCCLVKSYCTCWLKHGADLLGPFCCCCCCCCCCLQNLVDSMNQGIANGTNTASVANNHHLRECCCLVKSYCTCWLKHGADLLGPFCCCCCCCCCCLQDLVDSMKQGIAKGTNTTGIELNTTKAADSSSSGSSSSSAGGAVGAAAGSAGQQQQQSDWDPTRDDTEDAN
jgi:hypothetical protein